VEQPGGRAAVDAKAFRERRRCNCERWDELVAQYLPLEEPDSPWRFSRVAATTDPAQGWKLHVSATVLNAVPVMEACAPLLEAHGLLYKAVRSLDVLAHLNSGLRYGFSQVGKFMTVYPSSDEQAVELAEALHERTAAFHSPPVPFDVPFRAGSCVHYRYGGFATIEIEESDGARSPAIRDPTGKLVPDLRAPGRAVPDWLVNPFGEQPRTVAPGAPLSTQVLVYDVLSQRGKGGVYRGVDIRDLPASFCILKEGRAAGETMWDGRDGRELLRYEETVLRALQDRVPVPRVLTSFDVDDNRYLALELVEGEALAALCVRPWRKLPVAQALACAAGAARVIAAIHAAGWVWRDCKPSNLVLTPEGSVRPIDFEGAVRVQEPCDLPYGTPAYAPPELRDGAVTGTNVPEDLYALGASIYHLLTSFQPEHDDAVLEAGTFHQWRRPVGVLRRGVPPPVRELVAELLATDPRRRPTATAAAELLERYAGEMPTVRAMPPPPRKPRRRGRSDEEQERIERLPGANEVVLKNPRPRARPVRPRRYRVAA
jgi:hypothetical protein